MSKGLGGARRLARPRDRPLSWSDNVSIMALASIGLLGRLTSLLPVILYQIDSFSSGQVEKCQVIVRKQWGDM
jgi:hypothetical protein